MTRIRSQRISGHHPGTAAWRGVSSASPFGHEETEKDVDDLRHRGCVRKTRLHMKNKLRNRYVIFRKQNFHTVEVESNYTDVSTCLH